MKVANNNNDNNSLNNDPHMDKKKEKKYYGNVFVINVIIAIIISYYTYAYELIWCNINPNNLCMMISLLIIFNILIVLLLWCFYVTMKTRPGEIPLYWGFYIGDDDFKRKRYCLICNAFKPERSHHCSICNVCVLNMDHHCPWVDNCIGFYNRKYFMQLLFYACCLTIYFDLSVAYFIYLIIKKMIEETIAYKDIFHIFIVLIVYNLIFAFSFVITMFFRFHLRLILNNSTTIESLDKDHQKENEKVIMNVI